MYFSEEQSVVNYGESLPIIHAPTFLGEHPFILGSNNVLENGTAYSYVWINASEIKPGDSFLVFPAINVPLKGIKDNNLTAMIVFEGSDFGASPYWVNFSVTISALQFSANFSQQGISQNYSRSEFSLGGSQSGAEFFAQLSNVVNSFDEFEFFFYLGNASTPVPQLSHGPVR